MWISIKDKMPIEDQEVQVKGDIYRYGCIVLAEVIKTTKYLGNGIFKINVENDEDYFRIAHWNSKINIGD